MKFKLATLLLALSVALPLLAHGDKVHVMGTIEKISAEAVVVKTREGKTVEVKLTPKTAYMTSAGKAAKFEDLATGQRVVIHADPKGADLIATTVKLAPAGTAAASSTPK